MAVVAPFPSLSTLDKPIDVSPVSFVEAGPQNSCDHLALTPLQLGPPRDAVELFKQ
jgi:hypothetical protein